MRHRRDAALLRYTAVARLLAASGVVLIGVAAWAGFAHRPAQLVPFGAASIPSSTASVRANAPSGSATSVVTAPRPLQVGPAAPLGVPVSMAVPALDVAAPVVSVLASRGAIRPPDNEREVGWWMASQPPGAASGSTVIVGHVDSPAGPGALYRLVESRSGDAVIVMNEDGDAISYGVQSLRYYGKDAALPSALFATDGPPQLVLITCGGDFDKATAQYDQNVVVIATPIG